MNKRALVVDAIALVAYLVVANPGITGVAAHEWIGIGVVVVLVVHLAMHLDWVVDAAKDRAPVRRGARVGRLVLDAALAIDLVVCVVSGVFVSGAVLPALGLFADGYYFWDPLHAASAKLLLALLIVHLALNARPVASWLRRKDEGSSNSRNGQ